MSLCCNIVIDDNGARRCGKLARYEVTWSDRCAVVCADHLAAARASAANDGASDRTDTPCVVEIDNEGLVPAAEVRAVLAHVEVELRDVAERLRALIALERAAAGDETPLAAPWGVSVSCDPAPPLGSDNPEHVAHRRRQMEAEECALRAIWRQQGRTRG